MPYIKQEDRKKFKNILELGLLCDHPGELNYAITMLCKGYLSKKGMIKYQFLNDIIGALESCKLEYYRKIVALYENRKAMENGEV